jgi:sialic acid synthase SpsE
VSAYPAPLDEMNLAAMRAGGVAGLSDHSRHVLTGAFAVCVGATIIEAHIRDWGTQKDNPDFSTALDPYEFSEYVQHIRLAERMLGDGVHRVQPSEAPMVPYKVKA